ncbi:LTA synthase family protein [Chitinimonas taiwanensis]|uniref:Arylsulfatase A n=1 Tax=Chitinimonas taiwanensis DSM 18899 TaxID=1121279 RepID=A0A1K2HDG8_9NEIS|nr:sulfatase [Chitinimonas taiwanensis]SFZ74577.1 Arylsulfatase A [Chitinimonas taiwanensis DSM 18899]
MNLLSKAAVLRAYFAVFSTVAFMLSQRYGLSDNWGIAKTSLAFLGDVLILTGLLVSYLIGERILHLKPRYLGLWRIAHAILALFLIVFALASQALFRQTGDVLDIEMLNFIILNFSDLRAVAVSSVDGAIFSTVAVCLILYVMALAEFRRGTLRIFQRVMLIAPLSLLPANGIHESLMAEAQAQDQGVATAGNYRGDYKSLVTRQLSWLSKSKSTWWQGVFTSFIVGSALSAVEYDVLSRQVAARMIYKKPSYIKEPKRKSNILFVILESTRASATGLQDSLSGRSTTPFLDGLAREGWNFTRAYTTVPHTTNALVGIYCGTFPPIGKTVIQDAAGKFPLHCLPTVLNEAGYATAHFQVAPGHFEDRFGLLSEAGFQHRVTQEYFAGKGHKRYGYLGLDDRVLIDPMIEWMRENRKKSKPFFASILTVLTHHPYIYPGNVQPLSDPMSAKQAYLGAIRYNDETLQLLFAGMEREGLLDDTLVVVTGDHGEAFNEHGQLAHNGAAYEEGMHVPLVMYGPKLIEGVKKRNTLQQHIDLFPTVLDLIGVQVDGMLPGNSLLGNDSGHEKIITSCFYERYCLNLYDAEGGKFIYFFGKREAEFYALDADPLEKRNLIDGLSDDMSRQYLSTAVELKNAFGSVYARE